MRSPNRCRTTVWLWRAAFVGAAAAGAVLPGCSGSSGPEAKTGKPAAPVASIGASQTDPPDLAAPPQAPEPPAGTPESVLREAKLLRTKPFEGVTDPAKIAEARIERQKELVRLATEVLAKTHGDKAEEQTFDEAAFLLMNARLQLALCDDEAVRKENTDAIYEHAASFYSRNPESKAAAEAAYTVAKLAHENARKEGSSDWLGELARQAQVFATKFPQERSRAVSLLYAAAWSCELHGLTKEAAECYALLAKDFPKTEEAATAAGSLRRLKLVGQPVQLGGSTFDGGYVSIDHFAGKPVVVVFWQSGNPKVAELMSVLEELQATHGDKVAVLGVALDEDEQAIDDFLKTHPLKWKQIFFADKAKRGWKNTVADYYGVKTVPSVWLVGADGKVRSTNLTVETTRQAVASLAK